MSNNKKKILKITLIILSILFIIIASIVAFGFNIIKDYYDNKIDIIETNKTIEENIEKSKDIELPDLELTEEEILKKELSELDLSLTEGGSATKNIYKVDQKDPNIINILLIGMDARNGESYSRSDCMIIASYNKKTHSVKLTSILRDTWAHLPEYGWSRINTATAYGGAGLLVNTINEMLDLDIQHYVQIKFEEFSTVIDILGGIDVELTQSEINYINNKLHIEDKDWKNDVTASPGIVHLNGKQALWHCRNRSIGNSDFARTERQRDVLEIILNNALDMDISQITKLIYEMKDHVDMNVPIDTIVTLAKDVLLNNELIIESYQIPYDNMFYYANKSGASVIELKTDETKENLHKILGYIKEEKTEIEE